MISRTISLALGLWLVAGSSALVARSAVLEVPSPLYPSIAAGIDSASVGDTVLVACGEYQETGLLLKKNISLLSATGEPDCAIIDGQGLDKILQCDSLSAAALVQGFTFRAGQSAVGGDVSLSRSSPLVSHCAFVAGEATKGGGLACTSSSSPVISHCVFAGNTASNSGGGFYCSSASSPQLSHCTFAENWAYFGGGVYIEFDCDLVLLRSIIVDSANGEAVACGLGSSAQLFCCDLFNNADGDWTACVAEQEAENGNFALDPKFCGVPGSGNLYLRSDSPCSAPNNDCGEDIGALPVLCGETSAAPANLSGIKQLY